MDGERMSSLPSRTAMTTPHDPTACNLMLHRDSRQLRAIDFGDFVPPAPQNEPNGSRQARSQRTNTMTRWCCLSGYGTGSEVLRPGGPADRSGLWHQSVDVDLRLDRRRG